LAPKPGDIILFPMGPLLNEKGTKLARCNFNYVTFNASMEFSPLLRNLNIF
jgi:hypothetical protein